MSGMTAYFARRLMLVPFTFIAITLMVYSVLRVVPGGPVEQAEMVMQMSAMQGEAGGVGGGDITDTGEMQLDEESLQALQRYYSLDRPIIVGYMQWLGVLPRERRTRVQASTIERHPDVFERLRELNSAKQHYQDQFADILEENNLMYAGGEFYEEIADIVMAGDHVPDNIRERAERMRVDGFRGRARHLSWLMERGYSARGNILYEKVDSDTYSEKQDVLQQAEWILKKTALIDFKLDDVLDKYGYEIERAGSIYKVDTHFGGILQLDFGRSYTHGRPVISLIVSKMEVSIQFGLIGYFMTWIVCIPLGVFKALKHRSVFDTGTSFVVFLGYAMPGFIVALVLLSTVAANVDWLPLGGYKPDNIEEMTLIEAIIGRIRHMLIPVIGYMVGGFATMTILMKNSLLDNLGADYVRTGFAKGLSEKRVVFVHALRNSLIPITAGIGHAIGLLFAGSFLIEKTCNIDGMGLMGFEAVLQRDYPIIMATLVIGVIIRLFGNIFSDIIWALIDPRIRFG
jgi:microcin C transport system permease protein